MFLNWYGHTITGTPQEINEFLKLNQPMTVGDSLNRFIKTDNSICCPHCGSKHYMKLYSMQTLMNVPEIYKDGVLQKSDVKNQTQTTYQCLVCGKEFSSSNDELASVGIQINECTSARKVVELNDKESNN